MKLFLGLATFLHAANAANDYALGDNPDQEGQSPDQYPIIPVPPVAWSDPIPHNVMLHYQQHHEHQLHKPSSHGPPNKLKGGHVNNLLPSLKHSHVGTFPNLVILLRFSDHVDRELPSQEDISLLYNSENVTIDDHESIRGNDPGVTPTGSVRQVYFSNSHSTFTVETTVIDWITVSNTESYYADGQHGLSKSKFKEAMNEALTILETQQLFDFGEFDRDDNGALDGFGVLHSGYGAEFGKKDCYDTPDTSRIWSHKGGMDWASGDGSVSVDRYYVSSALRGKCKSNIVRIGVLCHELGHYIGLPDLYDPTFKGNGLGGYDFMSQSWGLDGTGLFPPNMSAWSKLQVGWATAELIESDGTYQLEAAAYNSTVCKITSGFQEGEYLLLENRQPEGYDSLITQGGIAIYHVDERAKGQRKCGYPGEEGWPQNGHHYKVALLPADGNYNLEEGIDQGHGGDLWHANSVMQELLPGPRAFPNTDSYRNGVITPNGIRIYDFSASGDTMTFKVEGITSSTSNQSSIVRQGKTNNMRINMAR